MMGVVAMVSVIALIVGAITGNVALSVSGGAVAICIELSGIHAAIVAAGKRGQ